MGMRMVLLFGQKFLSLVFSRVLRIQTLTHRTVGLGPVLSRDLRVEPVR
jgi:hypothetical protein